MGERVRVRGVRKEEVMKELFNKSFSRRSFLTALGVGVGAAALDWEEIEALASTVEDKSEYPVVVIGSGLGGLTAAASLVRKGFPVTVLEQREPWEVMLLLLSEQEEIIPSRFHCTGALEWLDF
jgi:hypothetical protein